MQTIVIPESDVKDLEGLEMMAEGLGRITGGKVSVECQYVIKTDNIPAWLALKSLLGQDAAPAVVKPASEKGNGKLTRNVRSWTVDGSDEKLTGREVTRMLASHSFEDGITLHHPKQGTMVVVRGLDGEPDSLLEKGVWEARKS